ncbi:MAG: 23S rRNA pseudouridine(2605) synthase RluB [Succinivibrio sp.]
MTEKLQKILSRAGIASRRALEQMIDQGRVTVNGKIASIGDRFEADSIVVKIDGREVLSPDSSSVSCRVLMYHKPEGELTTLSDPENRPTVFDHIPKPPSGRWIYIGRLDINTSGLLLFTTDGELANALMHPKFGVERIYAARIYGEVTEEQLDRLTQGVMLEDGKARFSKVTYVGGERRNAWYHVSLKEGRKREVRRLWEAVGLKVSRLIRIRYAGIDLDPELKTGQFRELTLKEINKLRKAVKLPEITEQAPSLELKSTGATKGRKPQREGSESSRASFDRRKKAMKKEPDSKQNRSFGRQRNSQESKNGFSEKSGRKTGTFGKGYDREQKFTSGGRVSHVVSHSSVSKDSSKPNSKSSRSYAIKSRGSATDKTAFFSKRKGSSFR